MHPNMSTQYARGNDASYHDPSLRTTEPGLSSHWHAVGYEEPARRPQRLELLDLPLDLLELIVKEVTHTNDLTALALTNSTLHKLATPHIYSRFDIVWPDSNSTVENRAGVDALTYGLATLVMGPEIFGETHLSQKSSPCDQCGNYVVCQHRPSQRECVRRGNSYAHFTRKFSLGNGPEDWVREYIITKEAGKMLGTLVAVAVGRMRNLESFTWDMPTGVLRDVWLALSSLARRDDGVDCKLKRVWVRWHDNTDHAGLETGPFPSIPRLLLMGQRSPAWLIPPYPRVEFPTFSVLPPLHSLTVLDIDELSYAEEMSVLVERSLDGLEELRVGLAAHAELEPWARAREDKSSNPAFADEPGQRSGGFLGILVSQFCPRFSSSTAYVSAPSHGTPSTTIFPETAGFSSVKASASLMVADREVVDTPSDINRLCSLLTSHEIDDCHPSEMLETPAQTPTRANTKLRRTQGFCETTRQDQVRRLQLQVLELERIYLSTTVLLRAFDWSRLSSLALLGCRNHEQLWKGLRKHYSPLGTRRESSTSLRLASWNGKLGVYDSPLPSTPAANLDYTLKLTRIQIDCVSSAFLAFVKDTLAPDTLECLFLQQHLGYTSTVTVDQIHKHIVKRHRNSLRRFLINSETRVGGENNPIAGWRRWIINRDLIASVTSGRMKLRELSVTLDYKDWHYFLQRLPNASSLRSLHITYLADPVHGRVDAKETAQQILDVVALRPELELCYVGVKHNCFEILEVDPSRVPSPPLRNTNRQHNQHQHQHQHQPNSFAVPTDSELSDDQLIDENENENENGDNDDDDEENNDDEDNAHSNSNSDSDFSDDANAYDTDSANSSDLHSNDPSTQTVTFKLREIVFYDDKVSIFKARHGKL